MEIDIKEVKPNINRPKKKKKTKFKETDITKSKFYVLLGFIILSAIFLITLITIYSIRFVNAYKERDKDIINVGDK